MRRAEPVPRYGALLLFAIVLGGIAALVASPIILTLMLVMGAGQ